MVYELNSVFIVGVKIIKYTIFFKLLSSIECINFLKI